MAQAKVVKGPGRRNMGPAQKIEHPFQIIGKILKFMSTHYLPHLIIVLVCIVASVFANVQGTWFLQSLIDEYIMPMIKSGSSDFSPLLGAMGRVGVFLSLIHI